MRPTARALPLAALAFALGCQNTPLAAWLHREPTAPPQQESPPPSADAEAIEPDVLVRAQIERREYLEREVERLREDLQEAESSIVQLESGLRGPHTRADVVSRVAEARIALDSVKIPWRRDRIAEAREKLEEADRQLASGHLGSALFFASRAQRITDSLRAETRQVANWDGRRVIRGDRVNLRSAPSLNASVVKVLTEETPLYPERSLPDWTLVRTPDGRVGWVHRTMLK